MKRRLSIVSAIVALALALTGCSGFSEPSKSQLAADACKTHGGVRSWHHEDFAHHVDVICMDGAAIEAKP